MIRLAKPDDSTEVIPLIHSAIGDIAVKLTGTTVRAEMDDVLTMFFRSRGNRFSYENVLVKVADGRVVGFMLSYHGSEAPELDRPILERLIAISGDSAAAIEKEANEDEYYLDSIGVDDAYQGRGFGKELLHAFETRAAELGYSKVSLICEQENRGAFGLYDKMGYKTDGSLTVCGHGYWHMIKQLG